MEWLTSLAPVLSPLLGTIGVLGGAWLVYRGNQRKTDTVDAVQTLTQGFSELLEQQRATNAQTLERVATLENRVQRLEEAERQWRRWKAAAVEYIHHLRALVTKLYDRPVPAAPREIAEDLGDEPDA